MVYLLQSVHCYIVCRIIRGKNAITIASINIRFETKMPTFAQFDGRKGIRKWRF